MSDNDPREEIERLEAQIDELSARLESCRKFILAGRIAIVVGGVLFAALFLRAVPFDPRLVALAVAAALGGIVAWGANSSTAKEATAELAAVEAERAALIETIDLRLIPERPTLH
jgi:hypothetical protein